MVQYLNFKNDGLIKGITAMNKRMTDIKQKSKKINQENKTFREHVLPDY